MTVKNVVYPRKIHYFGRLIKLCQTTGCGVQVVNLRGIPTPVCPCCGSSLLRLTVQFDPDTYEVEMYLLDDAECVECKCLITAPTPLDHPEYEAM
jgi:hypothetical protein